MKMVGKAVIFDMDGTLVDNIPYHEKSWISFLAERGIDIKPENFSAQNHGTLDEMIMRFFGSDISKEKLYQLGIEKEKAYQIVYKDHIREINGLTSLLRKLNGDNIKIGLATMGIPSNIDFILDGLNIRHYFHEITGGLEVTKGKPDPEIFLKTLEKLGLDSKDCIAVEDSKGGIQAAKEAGLRVVGITTSYSKEELLDIGCSDVIHDFNHFNFTKQA